ncbi:MAG: hypothetical protein ABI720_08285 [Actinomycetes bacterium]
MKSAYRVLAYIIAVEVVVQASMIAFAFAGLGIWVDKDGGVLDKAAMESDLEFTGVVGFMVHGINGMMLIPLIALVFLIVSFFAKIPGGVAWALTTLGLVILQVTLGLFGHESAYFGMLHGINALALFTVALMAARRVPAEVTPGSHSAETAAAA